MPQQELTLEQSIDLEAMVSWISGSVKISLCKKDRNIYYVAITDFGREVTITPVASFNEAHQAYIAGCLAANPQKKRASITLDEALEIWHVFDPGDWINELTGSSIGSWWGVANDEGIIAYFSDEADAFRFRLAEINRMLNP